MVFSVIQPDNSFGLTHRLRRSTRRSRFNMFLQVFTLRRGALMQQRVSDPLQKTQLKRSFPSLIKVSIGYYVPICTDRRILDITRRFHMPVTTDWVLGGTDVFGRDSTTRSG